ncbi:MAG TPA: hypothetical protein VFI25_00675 [Planctomycetota bacterium]|nr:hypothetical protein [Planctomycetota bacterium]
MSRGPTGLHREVLPAPQREALRLLADPASKESFYLAGGTASPRPRTATTPNGTRLRSSALASTGRR